MAMLILMIGQMVNVGTGAVGTILTMTAQQKSWFIISGVMLLVNFGLNVMLIPRFGFIGAAVANSLTISGLFIAGLLRVRFSLHLWPYDKRYRKGIVAGCLMAAAGFGFTRAVSLTPLWMILGTAVICASVFAVSLLLQGLDDEDYELLDLVRSRFG
ncbi:MAG: polysaccharide biosynthesis C-terminal domain-containing protein [Chloroflexi bacterium]|nr:polysaccharide biosynthesis C-terminal domain-containing protein [Chloroflexota bacterium]